MQLADRIKDFIEANKSSGMSQNKFATALGIYLGIYKGRL